MSLFKRRSVLAGLTVTTALTACSKAFSRKAAPGFRFESATLKHPGGAQSSPSDRGSPMPDMTSYDAFASARQFADTPSGRIAYVEVGAGHPAIFIHGLGLNSFFWSGQLQGLANNRTNDRRCIALDLMAHGHTEIDADKDVSFTAQAEMVLSFMDALGLDHVDLVGSDSGGAIAQIVATKAPARINSLVLTNCDVHDNWPPKALEAIRASAPDGNLAGNFAAMVANPELLRAEGGLASLVFENPATASDAFAQIFLGPLTATPERRAAFNRYVAPQDPSQLTRIEHKLRKLQAPCLILWGTDDIFFGLEWAYWLERTLPNARKVVEFDGAKLFFPFERPQQVNAQIKTFWQGLTGAVK